MDMDIQLQVFIVTDSLLASVLYYFQIGFRDHWNSFFILRVRICNTGVGSSQLFINNEFSDLQNLQFLYCILLFFKFQTTFFYRFQFLGQINAKNQYCDPILCFLKIIFKFEHFLSVIPVIFLLTWASNSEGKTDTKNESAIVHTNLILDIHIAFFVEFNFELASGTPRAQIFNWGSNGC